MNLVATAYATDAADTSDAIDSLAKTISDYGPLVVLLAIFFLIFISLMIVILKSNHKMMKQIMSRNSSNNKLEETVINKFVDGALKELTKDNDKSIKEAIEAAVNPLQSQLLELQGNHNTDDYHKDLVGRYININMLLKDASRAALHDLDCSRIAVYTFHNGNESGYGLPFFKMTCIHEWTRIGVAKRGKAHTEMPLQAFDDVIENLWEAGVYKSENVEETAKTDRSILDFIGFSGTKSLYMMAIRDDERDVITGFVVAEFDDINDFEHNETSDNEINSILNGMINKISLIVNNRHVFENRDDKE